jgi:hypothetical protein
MADHPDTDTVRPLKSESAKRLFSIIVDAIENGQPSEAIGPRNDLDAIGYFVRLCNPDRTGGPRR